MEKVAGPEKKSLLGGNRALILFWRATWSKPFWEYQIYISSGRRHPGPAHSIFILVNVVRLCPENADRDRRGEFLSLGPWSLKPGEIAVVTNSLDPVGRVSPSWKYSDQTDW